MRRELPISGDNVFKIVHNQNDAEKLVRVTNHLIANGVLTPPIAYSSKMQRLTFPYIDGDIGLSVFLSKGERALSSLIYPVIRILNCPPLLKLEPYDPFKRILPRICKSSDRALLKVIAELREAIDFGGYHHVVHGDFHLRQLICDTIGNVWIIDLDDAATGRPEIDVGNLIAYIATCPDIKKSRGIQESLDFSMHAVLTNLAQSEINLDHDQLRKYIQISLIRRGLKFREHNNQLISNEILDFSLSFAETN